MDSVHEGPLSQNNLGNKKIERAADKVFAFAEHFKTAFPVLPGVEMNQDMDQRRPPGPKSRWGGLNHLRAIRADFREFSHALHQTHGDIVAYQVFGQHLFQIARPDLAHEVLVERSRSFQKPDNQKRAFGRLIGNNLFTSDGNAWASRRRLLAPLFQPQIVDRYRAIVATQAERVFGQLSEGEVNLSLAANRISLFAVAEALFGAAVHDVADQFLDVVTQMQGAISRQIQSPILLPLWIPTRDNRAIRSALKFFHHLLSKLIDERRQSPGKFSDMLTVLLSATDAQDGKQLSNREAMDEALTMLLAGSDTTAASLSWSAYLLAKNPEMQRLLQEEISKYADGTQHLGEEPQSPQLPQQVFQESMRLYPPGVAIARQAIEPVEIGGVQIPRGALVFVSVYSIHHDYRWFPEPEKFQPSRFAPEHQAKMPENAFLAFGLGPRACVGRRFAMMEGPIILAELVRKFELQLIHPSFEPELETQLTLHPRGGLRLRLKHRAESSAQGSKI